MRPSQCIFVGRAIRKHGKKNFSIKTLAKCNSLEELNHREQYYIRLFDTLYPNGYNLRPGGDNSMPSDSTKKKMSKAKIGKNNPNFGKEKSKRVRMLIQKGQPHRKPIVCNETGKIYQTMKEAARDINAPPGNLSKLMKGERKKVKGLTFSYF